jgi:hypothetical protein
MRKQMYQYNLVMEVIALMFAVLGGISLYSFVMYWHYNSLSQARKKVVKEMMQLDKDLEDN